MQSFVPVVFTSGNEYQAPSSCVLQSLVE